MNTEPPALDHPTRLQRYLQSVRAWFDSHAAVSGTQESERRLAYWLRCLPLVILHAGCLGVIWVGWSWTAVIVALGLYFVRMFAVTAFYHRYFSHRSFKTSRAAQFLFAVVGNSAAQRGPLWWSSHHRHHHRHSDQVEDAHSPHQHGFWCSHLGWITARENFKADLSAVPDLTKYPELVFLDRFDNLIPFLLGGSLYIAGELCSRYLPALHTTGPQLLVWGFFISTTVLFHATCTINSLAHLIGKRRYHTTDHSRNSWFLALLTLGEGWHNNHHRYPGSTRQGFFWWEIDITFYLLKALSWMGVIWELNPVPLRIKQAAKPAAQEQPA